MRKRILVALALAMAITCAASALPSVSERSSWGRDALALVAPSDADAYLHLANAQAKCREVTAPGAAQFGATYYGTNGTVTVYTSGPWYHRFDSDSIVVHAVHVMQFRAQAEVRCWITGSDEAPVFQFGAGYPVWTYTGRFINGGPSDPCHGYQYVAYCLMDPGFS